MGLPCLLYLRILKSGRTDLVLVNRLGERLSAKVLVVYSTRRATFIDAL